MQTKLKPVYFIIIAGGTASGKTTFAKKIANAASSTDTSVRYWSMDSYYKDYPNLSVDQKSKINFDHPDSIDLELLIKHFNDLKNRKAIEVPNYDFATFSRSKQTSTLEPADVIIFDGILALHTKEVREFGNLKLFVKVPDDIRFIRRLQRDVKERNRTIDSVVEQYISTVKPMHDLFVEPSMDLADLIIPYNGGDTQTAMDLVITKAKDIIGH